MPKEVKYESPEESFGLSRDVPRRNIESEMAKCVEFLVKNGWEPREIGGNVYSMNRPGFISVDLVKDEGSMTFIGDTGDFLHRPIDKYTLIGVLLEHRQLPINYKS